MVCGIRDLGAVRSGRTGCTTVLRTRNVNRHARVNESVNCDGGLVAVR